MVSASMLGVDLTIAVARGTAQGGVLSPLVWNLVMDTLLRRMMHHPGAYSETFADDLTKLIVGLHLGTV